VYRIFFPRLDHLSVFALKMHPIGPRGILLELLQRIAKRKLLIIRQENRK
jgi:hypothetical protein